ncbi:hypothetical protein [Treponema pedis]|uniref:hypothetical protein n=1 Tax=Treponema pedis TaxID=409322 RepID=UPI0031423895
MTKQKPGWKYIYSESIKQEIAIHLKTGWVCCKDGTRYSPSEILMLKENKIIVTQKVHNIKKIFEGEFFKIENLQSAKIQEEKTSNIDTDNNIVTGELEIW